MMLPDSGVEHVLEGIHELGRRGWEVHDAV